ncbi:hypothetical protein JHW43_002394 [Diplocarpon mali]|nr:hypothetical protein JHW43_002394 [Diplocarpon mali]
MLLPSDCSGIVTAYGATSHGEDFGDSFVWSASWGNMTVEVADMGLGEGEEEGVTQAVDDIFPTLKITWLSSNVSAPWRGVVIIRRCSAVYFAVSRRLRYVEKAGENGVSDFPRGTIGETMSAARIRSAHQKLAVAKDDLSSASAFLQQKVESSDKTQVNISRRNLWQFSGDTKRAGTLLLHSIDTTAGLETPSLTLKCRRLTEASVLTFPQSSTAQAKSSPTPGKCPCECCGTSLSEVAHESRRQNRVHAIFPLLRSATDSALERLAVGLLRFLPGLGSPSLALRLAGTPTQMWSVFNSTSNAVQTGVAHADHYPRELEVSSLHVILMGGVAGRLALILPEHSCRKKETEEAEEDEDEEEDEKEDEKKEGLSNRAVPRDLTRFPMINSKDFGLGRSPAVLLSWPRDRMAVAVAVDVDVAVAIAMTMAMTMIIAMAMTLTLTVATTMTMAIITTITIMISI